MTNQIKLKIITPKGIFWNDDINIVTLKTTEGYIGLQKNKSPFVASLDVSELHINEKNSKNYKTCAIAGGLVMAKRHQISIITDAIEFKEKINLLRAQVAKRNAKKQIKANLSKAENKKAQFALKKAINRIEIGNS